MSPKMQSVIDKFDIQDIKSYLFNEYWTLNKSGKEIGDNLNVDRKLITEWMRQLGIPRRNNTEKIRLKNSINISPTEKQWQMILGLWMGDGNIRKVKGGVNSQLRITHSIKFYDYLKYKQEILEENNLFRFKEYRRKGGGLGGENCIRYSLESQCTPLLNKIYENCYTYGKSNLSEYYLNQINEYGLYIWYLDDGNLQSNSHIVLCTDNFTYEENEKIVKYFNRKYFLNPIIYAVTTQWGTNYRLRFNVSDSKRFIKIIEKYKNEVPIMLYKFEINNYKMEDNDE